MRVEEDLAITKEELREAQSRIVELEGLCKDWVRWAMEFQHLGAIGRDLLERTNAAL